MGHGTAASSPNLRSRFRQRPGIPSPIEGRYTPPGPRRIVGIPQWTTAADGTNRLILPDGPNRSTRYHHESGSQPPRTSHDPRGNQPDHAAPAYLDQVETLAAPYQVGGLCQRPHLQAQLRA